MSQIVLIVDDDITSLKLAMSIIEKDYRVATAVSGEMTLKYLEKNRPDLILLDLNMPEMDGLDVMEVLKADPEYSNIPVIFLTASHSPQIEAKCLDVGALDFVSKPFIPQVLKSRVRRILELNNFKDHMESMVREQSEELIKKMQRIADIYDSIAVGLAGIIEERDSSKGRHVSKTRTYVSLICEALKEKGDYSDILTDEYIAALVKVSPLYNIGKIRVPETILQKDGLLSEEEFDILKKHPRFGADIMEILFGDIRDDEYLRLANEVTLFHHERWDGTGYPEGLAGNDIPLAGRIMAAADMIDILANECADKMNERCEEDMFAIIGESEAKQLDPTIVNAIMSCKDKLTAVFND